MTTLDLAVAGSGKRLPVQPGKLIVAGCTACDEAAVARHIEEPAAIGVPPPLGSDHTYRELERDDIAASNAACPKPVGGEVGRTPSFPDWYRAEATSEVDGRPYQAGAVHACSRRARRR